jgi:hypothetical protein
VNLGGRGGVERDRMEKTQIILLSVLISLASGIVIYASGPTLVSETVGIVIVFFSCLMGILSSTPTASGVSKIAWLIFSFLLLVACLAFGYVALVLKFPLGSYPLNSDALGLSVLLVELSIITSTLFVTYRKFEFDFKKAGYEVDEIQSELSSFSRMFVFVALGSVTLSLLIYLFLQIVPQLQIDSLSVLIIATIVYFAIARYVLRTKNRKMETKEESSLTTSSSPSKESSIDRKSDKKKKNGVGGKGGTLGKILGTK